jgi:hypothetical protein
VVSGLAIVLHSQELGKEITILNLYGPYDERVLFWDKLFNMEFWNLQDIILGGDLNFSVGRVEVWGQVAKVDPLSDYFIQKLEDKGLIDVEPIKLRPTWWNKQVGVDMIAKRIDKFLISKGLL